MIYFKLKGIATGCHYTPLSMQPLFKPFAKECPVTEKEHYKFITMPLHADLSDKEIDYVINVLNDFEMKND